MKLFSVAIRQEDDTFYAQVPDLPDIHVIGDSIADTIDKVRSTLIGYLQKLADDGSDLPQPENITNHLTNPKFAGQTWAIISLNSMLFNSKQKSFNLHLPRALLTQIQAQIGYDEHDIEAFILKAIEHELTNA
ncbi:type II toxin-antitoxin system HicB family antitoxin [Moraxella bovis]|uniref:Type II toxin-antitoxin system HicB family antitoxin n=1 Tax=Moraxella bovis TaxID=476 RepID=A0A378PYG6_MORBO|nr:type II toxin-antitoxin system HicB family antitoxin [Moraxella bovis]UYZ74616.1 type II toxin-antitoxin system HicB family antitoxin [Moraxella bovis]UYZ79459.1 type II toxin-antitoxin system HicB family antitoxin [Moraxella bovis]UYZ79940.1 type II toxin-antitoxin system HicB family antitoxin [Moraxella bovis]UYZ87940.1 type II toxin-antitoxin system HicB family antitoxin [Moraxella bovis]UYZ90667.1 type II toxin-antitoxin system HicB family antitoxin [Moraxella bovis]